MLNDHNHLSDNHDPLKKIIDEHREAFDDEVPGNDVWNSIEKRLPPSGKVIRASFSRNRLFLYAAAAIILSITGIGMWKYVAPEPVNVSPEIVFMRKHYPEYAQQMVSFAGMVEVRQNELKKLKKEAPLIYKNFTQDLNYLDSMYGALKIDLYTYPNQEEVIVAMIQNLQIQVEILNKQLEIIKSIKAHNSQSHENQ